MSIIEACENGDLEMLMNLAYDPKTDIVNQAIRSASWNRHWDIVKYLISIGCDPKKDWNYPLRAASAEGNLDMVKYLVGLGCEPDSGYLNSVDLANENNNVRILRYFFEIGCKRENGLRWDIYTKYYTLQDVKVRLLTFTHTIPNNRYLKMEIIKRVIPNFPHVETQVLCKI